MTRDALLLNDLWDVVKEYVPKQDKLNVAHLLIEVLDEYSLTDGFDSDEFDGQLARAVRDYFGEEEEEDDSDDC